MERNYEKEREYLLKLVEDINKDVHKKQEKYSRKKWIYELDLKKLDIKFDSLENYSWVGVYIPNTNEIIINKRLLENNTLNPSNRCSKEQKRLNKKIKGILIHELCHYWCNCWLDIYGMCYSADNSPLFIALNYYLNPDEFTNYTSFEEVECSRFKQEIDKLENLEEVQRYLVCTANRINRIMRKYPYIKFEFEDEFEHCMYNYHEYMFEDAEEAKFLSAYRYRKDITDLVCESLQSFKKEETSEDEREIIEKRIEKYKNGESKEYLHTIVLPRELYDLDKIEKEVDFLAKEIENELKNNNVFKN